MAKANRKALGFKDMEILLFGKVLHPTNKQIVTAKKEKNLRLRNERKKINTSTFTRKPTTGPNRRDKTTEQIDRGFKLAEEWNKKYPFWWWMEDDTKGKNTNAV